ncbi:hypothetical protein Taro_000856 [Colocasia esculenta]|uniref:PAM68-like protein n=1 Tax=Colocasia esculenta TaxID=4460 RepID=A0A843TED6_COLES|nr:hypothetical protein [Colocasia esculenta]
MATPARLQALQLPSRTPRTTASPWPGRAPPAILHAISSSGRKRQRLAQAGARGFSLAAAEKKGSRGEDEAGRSNRGGRDGGGDGGGDGNDEDDAIPQVVFDRMVRRVVASVATPMAGGVGLLFVMSTLKESGAWDVPAWLPFVTTLVCFGTSALGMAYGTLSTSWDPEREGSVLGWGEVRRNWPELWKDDDEERGR